MGLNLTSQDVSALEDRAEDWAAWLVEEIFSGLDTIEKIRPHITDSWTG